MGNAVTFDFQDPAYRADPYPVYARMRREAPVLRIERPNHGSVYLAFRYADVMRMLREPQLFANDPATVWGKSERWWTPGIMRNVQLSMVNRDGETHRRLRNLVHKAFTAGRVEALRGRIETLVNGMLDRAAAEGRMELIADLALPLPLIVISEMMGVDEKDRRGFHRWMAGLLDLEGASKLDLLLRAAPRAVLLNRFLERLIDERRRGRVRGDDLISALVAAEEQGDHLSSEELLSMVFLLLLAGHETTVNLIGNGVLALLEHPEQLERLRREPALIEPAVEELLRFTNPVQHPATRHVVTDTELGGVKLPRGSVVVPMLASANRDEEVFAAPDTLDLGRTPNKHLAFGFGVHYCVGAQLARLEAAIALSALVQRFPNLRLGQPRESLRWRKSAALRGLQRLELAL